MSDYSSTYPTQSPTFAFDAKAGKLDSRISYTRSSTGTAFSAERHLSSLNLLSNSGSINGSGWSSSSVSRSQSGTFIDGSNAFVITETAATAAHYFQAASSNFFSTVAGESYTVILFAKSGTVDGLQIVFGNGTFGANAYANFDLSNAATTPVTGSSATASITALGSDWVKCVVTATATVTGTSATSFALTNNDINATRFPSYAGSTSNNIAVWQCNISSTGETVLNETSGQIHREFAPTLKSYSSDQPRFEYSAADGQSVGTALGLLVESQATNLTKYSDDFSSWGDTSTVVVTPNAGVAPNGQLEADLLVSPSSASTHYILDSTIAFTSGTTYTASVYVKSAGQRYVQLCGSSSAFGTSPYQWVNYDLEAGTLNANNCSGTITAVGNGYYRITATMTATVTSTKSFLLMFADSLSAGFFPTTTGDDYNGFLAFGFQTESGSAASSLISTSGAAATRSADSCSVATADFGYTGGSVSVISEFSGGAGYYPEVWELRDTVSYAAGVQDYILQLKYSASAGSSTDWRTWINESSNLSQVTLAASASATKLGVSVDSNSVASCADGGTIYDMTSTVIPDSLDTLYIGTGATGNPLNGHIKRLSLYSVALSDVELQSLTSNP